MVTEIRTEDRLSAKDVAARAKLIENSDPPAAHALYREAAEAARGTARTSFERSQYLTWARKGGADLEALSDEARMVADADPRDPWIAGARVWILLSLSKQRKEQGNRPGALAAVDEAARLLPLVKGPALAAAVIVTRCGEVLNKGGGADAHDGGNSSSSAFVALLRAHGDILLSGLSEAVPFARRVPLKDGSEPITPLKRLFYLARKAAGEVGDAGTLEKFMAAAVAKHPEDEWFAEAFVRAAALRGDLAEAGRRGEAAFERHPESWAVACARGDAAERAGAVKQALAIVLDGAIGSNEPWPWQRLAEIHERAGDTSRAIDCLAFGLGFQRAGEAGLVWRLHYDRARLLAAAGRESDAAREAWLSMEARESAGWSAGADVQSLVAGHSGGFAPVLAVLQNLPKGQVRKDAVVAYRLAYGAYLDESALGSVVKSRRADGRFAIFALDDGRRAIAHERSVNLRRFSQGSRARAVVVRSFDRKRSALGWRVVWAVPETPKQQG